MVEYTADEGLNVLTYLGILNLTEREREFFRREWNNAYKVEGNLISTVWVLYSEALPFNCRDIDQNETAMQMVSMARDRDFGERLKETRLDEKLKQGLTLEEIFAENPERFSRTN